MICVVPVMHSKCSRFVQESIQNWRSLDEAGFTPEETMQKILGGAWTFWEISNDDGTHAFMITEFSNTSLVVVALEGLNRHLWLDPLEEWLTRYARLNKIPYLDMWGRVGWRRDGQARGWDEHRILYRKEITA